ncbi:multidrug transporter, partial [Paenibacillus darwinianus]
DPESSAAAAGSGARLVWKQRLLLMAAGIPAAVTGLLYYESMRYVSASLAIILLFQFTWIGVLIQAVAERRRPGGFILVSLAVLFGGTLLAAGIVEEGAGRLPLMGTVLGLLSAVSYSLFILLSGKALPGIRPAYRSVWMLAGGMMFVFILFPPEFLINGKLWSELLLYGMLLGLFGAFIPPVLFAVGVPRIGEGMASILGAFELPVAILASSIVLREPVSLLQWAGVVLVLIGVALPELEKRRSSLR